MLISLNKNKKVWCNYGGDLLIYQGSLKKENDFFMIEKNLG